MAEGAQNGTSISSVLLTEDDPAFARLLQKNLLRSGLKAPIEWLTNGKELLDFLESHRTAVANEEKVFVILLDLAMPVIDGFQVLKTLKHDHDLKKIPVFVLTTSANEDDEERCSNMGCDQFFVKPPDYGVLNQALTELIP